MHNNCAYDYHYAGIVIGIVIHPMSSTVASVIATVAMLRIATPRPQAPTGLVS